MMTIREYLSKYNLTVNKVASENEIYTSSFNSMAEKDLENVPLKYIFAIAKTLGKSPAQIIDEMLGIENDINIIGAEEIGKTLIKLKKLLDKTNSD